MKKMKWISLLCALAIIVGAMGACNSAPQKPENSSQPSVGTNSEVDSTVSDPYSELPEDGQNGGNTVVDDDWGITEDDSTGDDQIIDETERYEATISLYNDKPVQNSFLGFNAVYHAFTYRDDMFDREYTDRMIEAEFDRAKNSGIKIARSYYTISDAWDSKTKAWNWDGEKMQAIVDFCLGLKKRDIDVLLSHWEFKNFSTTYFHWSDTAPNGTASEGHEAIRGDGKSETLLQNFAVFMSQSIQHLHAKGCTNVSQIALATEPGGATWKDAWGSEEKDRLAYHERAAKTLANAYNIVSDQFKKDGIRSSVEFEGPHVTGLNADQVAEYLKYFQKYAKADAYDIIAAHDYHGSDVTADNYYLWDEWADEIETTTSMENFVWDEYQSRPIVDDRVPHRRSGHNGVQIALGQVAMMNHGVRGCFLWTLFDQLWPDNFSTAADSGFYDGIQINGLAPSFLTSSIVFQPYYSHAIVANAVTRGDTIYAGDDETFSGVYSAMSKGKDGSWNIVVVSTNIFETEITLNFEKSLGGATLYRHAYSADTIEPTAEGELITPDLKLTNTKKVLKDVIPAYSVVVYTTKQMCK